MKRMYRLILLSNEYRDGVLIRDGRRIDRRKMTYQFMSLKAAMDFIQVWCVEDGDEHMFVSLTAVEIPE
jgi:hypothetical protein